MRPRVRARSRGCHRPRVRSPQHGRPIGASIRGSPSSGRGSSGRDARGGHGGGDAAGAGGEAVPVPGGGRRGAAGAPGGRPQPAGLASGGHPGGVTPGLPQSGPGGKSAPHPPSPRLHPHFLAAILRGTSGTWLCWSTGGHAPPASSRRICPRPLTGSPPPCMWLPDGSRDRAGLPGVRRGPCPRGAAVETFRRGWSARAGADPVAVGVSPASISSRSSLNSAEAGA